MGVMAAREALAVPGRRAALAIAMITPVFPAHGGARYRADRGALGFIHG